MMTGAFRLTSYPCAGGKEGWAKEIGNMVMPASSDEVQMWKEIERLRAVLTTIRTACEGTLLHPAGLSGANQSLRSIGKACDTALAG